MQLNEYAGNAEDYEVFTIRSMTKRNNDSSDSPQSPFTKLLNHNQNQQFSMVLHQINTANSHTFDSENYNDSKDFIPEDA